MKKGLMLTANFLVMIIISLTALGMGLYITSKFFGTAEEIKDNVDSQTQKEIEKLMFEGDRVTVPFNKKDISRGKAHVFGLGILNTLNSGPDFNIRVESSSVIQIGGNEIKPGEPEYVSLKIVEDRPVNVKNNEFDILSVPIEVPRDGVIGTYIVNIFVCNGTVSDGICDGKLNEGATYTDELYDGFIHKVYVKVP